MSSQASIRSDEIRYLENQIYKARDGFMYAAFEKYLADDPTPETKEEMQKRIADGKFIVESVYSDGRHPCIRWRSPDKKKDQEGYDKVEENIEQAYRTALDAANVLPAPEALKELKKLREFQV